jgi:uncharacterized protein (DUF1501 family)
MMNRRDFLKAVTAASTAPLWVRLGPLAGERLANAASTTPARMLLVVYLAGGNDGLNTVAPFTSSAYKTQRPDLALRSDEVYGIGSGFGLHQNLKRVHGFWNAGHLAVVHNVGYPNPNFSHFESTYIWETASPEQRFHTGWLGRYLDATDATSKGPVRAVAVGMDALPRTLIGTTHTGVALNALSDFSFADEGRADMALRRQAFAAFGAGASTDASMRSKVLAAQEGTVQAVAAVSGAAKTVKGALTPAQTVATMFAAGVGTELGFIFVGGFDTHTTQRGTHAAMLGLVDTAIGEFFDAAKALGLSDRATVITFSDFGRRVGENASGGTDHGSSTPILVMGPRVIGGQYGPKPDLGHLVDGNLAPSIHFGSVYGSVIADAFGVDPAPILGGDYPRINLIA